MYESEKERSSFMDKLEKNKKWSKNDQNIVKRDFSKTRICNGCNQEV